MNRKLMHTQKGNADIKKKLKTAEKQSGKCIHAKEMQNSKGRLNDIKT